MQGELAKRKIRTGHILSGDLTNSRLCSAEPGKTFALNYLDVRVEWSRLGFVHVILRSHPTDLPVRQPRTQSPKTQFVARRLIEGDSAEQIFPEQSVRSNTLNHHIFVSCFPGATPNWHHQLLGPCASNNTP